MSKHHKTMTGQNMEIVTLEYDDKAPMRDALRLQKQEQKATNIPVGQVTLKKQDNTWYQRSTQAQSVWVAVRSLDDLILN